MAKVGGASKIFGGVLVAAFTAFTFWRQDACPVTASALISQPKPEEDGHRQHAQVPQDPANPARPLTPAEAQQQRIAASSAFPASPFAPFERHPRPADTFTPYGLEWDQAQGRFHNVSARHKDATWESLWASGRPRRPCGSPCVAHCVLGQIRSMGPNELKRTRRLRENFFDSFSTNPVVFAVVSSSVLIGGRERPVKWTLPDMEPFLLEVQPDHALVMGERCEDTGCYAKQTRTSCGLARNNGTEELLKAYGQTNYYTKYGECDIQFGRLQQCMNLVREYETTHHMTFDWVTRSRLDTDWGQPSTNVQNLHPDLVYMTPWDGRGCYGGFDWWYAVPRKHADVLARFRDEVSCKDLGRYEIQDWDPYYKKVSICHYNLGCEGWFASWMYSQGVLFTNALPLPWPARR